jgi:uncharacterized protein with PIN domain
MWRGHSSGRVVPLPRSWHRQAKRTVSGAPLAAHWSSTIIRWMPVSISGWCCRLRHAEEASTSGSSSAARRIAQHLEHAPGWRSISPRDSSCHTRSATSASTSPAATIWRISSTVSGATVKSAEARGEARQPQDAHRVFGEGRRHMAQHPLGQVALAAIGSMTRPCVLGHRIDGEVAACQVLLQRDIGCRMEREAVVAGAVLRSVRARATSSWVWGWRKTGKSLPTGW